MRRRPARSPRPRTRSARTRTRREATSTSRSRSADQAPRTSGGGEGAVVTAIPDIMLNNGKTIPQFGFGVFQIRPDDTAEVYGNEKQVGEAIAKSGLDRADVFVTSKLSTDAHRPGGARKSFDESLAALGTGHVDL